jgi:hypothetical protein
MGRSPAHVAVLCVFMASVAPYAAARGQRVPVRAPAADAVSLIVRPRVGDTLHLQVEQTMEMRARRVNGAAAGVTAGVPPVSPDKRGEPRPEYGPRMSAANARITRVLLYAHSLVESSDMQVTTLLATTDSIASWAGAPGETGTATMMPLPDDGRQVRVRVTPDGAMRVADPPPGAMELGATLASVPGLLPEGPVSVGSTWTRDLVLPSLPVGGYRADGVVRAKLRLDSLTRRGRVAWISLDGVLHRDGAAKELPAGTRVITAGTIRGTMVVDRVRAWIMDAYTVLDVQSEVAPGPAAAGSPMLLDLRIVQRVRVR